MGIGRVCGNVQKYRKYPREGFPDAAAIVVFMPLTSQPSSSPYYLVVAISQSSMADLQRNTGRRLNAPFAIILLCIRITVALREDPIFRRSPSRRIALHILLWVLRVPSRLPQVQHMRIAPTERQLMPRRSM